jgi:hypothetical protein
MTIADYVPRIAWGKVTSVIRVPDVLPSIPVNLGKPPTEIIRMSAFQEHKEELEHYEQMFGRHRGRLAVSLDRLTNAMVLVGQHGVYCTSQRNPAVPAMDIHLVTRELANAKELVQSVMEELRAAKEESRS